MRNLFRVLVVVVIAVFGGLSLTGCSGSSGDSWRYDPGMPEQVTGLEASSGVNLVSLSWKPIGKGEMYNIYYVSEAMGDKVTKANAIKISNVTVSQYVVAGLDNNVRYHFMVTAVNRNGEGPESLQVSETPRPPSTADLDGTWYFHTLVTGPDAKWERGTITVANGNAAFAEFEDSSGNTASPTGFTMSVDDSGGVSLSEEGAWIDFHGFMGSRKNMIIATHSPAITSRAITIFQKKKAVDYSIADIMGTGSGQNPNDPNLNGNGPTRFAYHQIYSGSNTEWEYCNAKVGQNGQFFTNQYKDVIYWDFSNPSFKSAGYDFFWKATSLGITSDGLVKEYWNFITTVNPAAGITSFNDLTPKQPYDTLFTGRMTEDKTVIVGVTTRTDANGLNPQYFLRIIQLCFKPADQSLAKPDLPELMGNYRFSKLGYKAGEGGGASWAYGTMSISAGGGTSFPQYADSLGNLASLDAFTLSYYTDPNPDGKLYRDFANFTSAALAGAPYYVDGNGDLLRTYFDFSLGYARDTSLNSYIDYSKRRQLNLVRNAYNQVEIDPATGKPRLIIPPYYNEHASLSLNRDMIVMTRTDSSGHAMIIGLK